ncbi:volume-regulated anion channel subunit LRRC8C-like [Engraulis encrasicolus]|uniref:volume-regulated anion channel subunit LRRC8C-like n=1 Tax=Engraulis encrasicolus TaxID=184585 RepID=UPI002FD66063
MIAVSELWEYSVQPQAFRILKPWWDVLQEMLAFTMMTIAVFGVTVQIMEERMFCLPQRNTTQKCSRVYKEIHFYPNLTEDGVVNNMDLIQYKFINQLCYQVALHWFPKCFPHLALIHTVFFMMCSNFWFKFPRSSSRIEHFTSILAKCFESPWTTQALSELVEVDTGVVTVLDKKECEQAKALLERIKKFRQHVEEGDVLFMTYMLQTLVKLLTSCFITTYVGVLVHKVQPTDSCTVEAHDITGYSHFCCIYTMAYLFSLLIYSYLFCILLYCISCLYTTFWLFYRVKVREYSFDYLRRESGVSDIPDLKNDFAFMLHLIDQYDPLYSTRFAIFLSKASENRLQQLNLNHAWPTSKLRERLQTNSSERLELHLFMLLGLPDTVFELYELQSLKLEMIVNAELPSTLELLTELEELNLNRSSLKVNSAALKFLKARLKVLRVRFLEAAELPHWLYVLANLEELHLTGSLSPSASRSVALESLRDLYSLKSLTLNSNLSKLPQAVTDVAPQMQYLCIHNDGTHLVMLNGLKKMGNLTEVELLNCGLECIPHAIFSLLNLQKLDLRDNKLNSVHEIVSFQNLPRFTCLKLWHNNIAQIPEDIRKLASLESLYFSHNRITSLPIQLFQCSRLSYLDLSHNKVSVVPPEIRQLQGSLQYLSLAYNQLQELPDELFALRKLCTLKLSNNMLSTLSPRVSNLTLLKCLELKGNHFLCLPADLGACPLLKQAGLVVESSLFETLPLDVKERMRTANGHD